MNPSSIPLVLTNKTKQSRTIVLQKLYNKYIIILKKGNWFQISIIDLFNIEQQFRGNIININSHQSSRIFFASRRNYTPNISGSTTAWKVPDIRNDTRFNQTLRRIAVEVENREHIAEVVVAERSGNRIRIRIGITRSSFKSELH
ncbi:Protein of unknown function [Cotesia congregata]|uniref:Uncharacterized protein n=1 Tax=Cotesia congregata TaxID=51543 RepID=A0A8J2MFH9_COTCN|nr:Protein of unknown function [Cotesia congregata]